MTEATLRVLQLNAGTLLEPGWEQRRHEVVAWIRHTGPDVVCLQEVWESDGHPNTAGWVATELGHGWWWAFGGHPFDERLWPDPSLRFGSAVLSRWPIDDHAVHRLPTVASDPDPTVHAVPWELFHARTAGLDLFVTHLAAAPHQGDHRVAQVLSIDEHVRGVRGDRDRVPGPGAPPRTEMPPILCGDLNAEPDSDEVRFLCGLTALEGRTTFFQDAWRVAGEGPGHTQDWRTNPTAAFLNVHRKRIDYVFVGDPFLRAGSAGRVLDASLACDHPLTGIVASDHAGLVVDITWPNRPTVDGDG